MYYFIKSLFTIIILSAASDVWSLSPPQPGVHPDLAAHHAQFLPARIEKTGERVYFAIGYDLANIIFVEGDDGVIVIDTGWWKEAAQRALSDFRKLSNKPIVAIIYTHGHTDHTGGAEVFIDDSGKDIPVYAHALWKTITHKHASAQRPNVEQRVAAQLGFLLPDGEDGTAGMGLGPSRHPRDRSISFIPPTHVFEKEKNMEIAGVKIHLFHAPSDLVDGAGIWLPDDKILVTGDAIGGVAPYVATPRYQPSRIPENFIRSIDKMMEFPAEHVLPGHGPKVTGRDQVHKILQDNRDLIQFLVDQTVRLINKDYSPGEIIEQIKLPEHLAKLPYLRDHYHRLSWTIRGIYMKTTGWYGGDPTEFIQPLPTEESHRMVTLAGGKKKLLKSAKQAYHQGDYGWAAQLATYLLRSYPELEEARKIKVYALRAAAYQSISDNERHYLLTEALELEGRLPVDSSKADSIPVEFLELYPIGHHFRLMGSKLDAEKSRDVMMTVDFHITDLDEHHCVILRRGVSQYKSGSTANADIQIGMSKDTFYGLITRRISWDAALNNGSLKASDSKLLKTFISYYEL